MKVLKTATFNRWFEKETSKSQAQIVKRIESIESHDHFGDFKHIEDILFELRWKNGRRIYFALFETESILLLGGQKNDQKKDIKKAKASLRFY